MPFAPTARTASLPPLPLPLADRYRAQHLTVRAFGDASDDIEIDLSRGPEPHQLTALLAACVRRDDGSAVVPELFWDMELGLRIEALLLIATLDGRGDMTVGLRCLERACAQPSEVDLGCDELCRVARAAPRGPIRIDWEGCTITLRRPTAADQLAWLAQRPTDPSAMVAAMIATLQVGGPTLALGEALIERINHALAEHDPLVHFALTVDCPACRCRQEVEIDLAAAAVQRLRGAQTQMLHTVHLLADRYHWPERDILALAPWRRAAYLALVERPATR